jgi:hypothetical protein
MATDSTGRAYSGGEVKRQAAARKLARLFALVRAANPHIPWQPPARPNHHMKASEPC